jgi:membrane associated rhomboid family serine protease
MYLICLLTDLSTHRFDIKSLSIQTLITYGANYNKLVNTGQLYRLFTPIFLHAGPLHLLANSISFFLYLMPV